MKVVLKRGVVFHGGGGGGVSIVGVFLILFLYQNSSELPTYKGKLEVDV